jgi:hypothetical protein
MKFKIYASLNLESIEPWIWTNYENPDYKGFIVIINPLNSKKIKCFKRKIDDNFLSNYNKSDRCTIKPENDYVLVINEYYRNKLEIETKHDYDLIVKNVSFLNPLFLNWDHPNPQVQYSNRMTVTSIMFGFLSLILAVIALCK